MNREVFGPLARLVSPGTPTLAGVAAQLALPAPGSLAFNPSPFGRSDTVDTADGGLRLITDVPGLGYAFEPAGDGRTAGRLNGRMPVRQPLSAIETSVFSASLDQRTGALTSLVDKASGLELVRSGGTINALDGATLSDGWVERYPGIGLRIVARRLLPGGSVTSRVTIHDSLPWVNLETTADDGASTPEAWRFDLAVEAREVRFEVAGGSRTLQPGPDGLPMLRWLALLGDGPAVFFGSDGPAVVTVEGETGLVVRRPARSTRFRLMVQRGFLLPDDPWRFGFGMLPLDVVPAPGTGSARLPSFGRLLEIGDPAVAVVGLKDADDGVGVMVYLMDLAGLPRTVPVRPGVLTFEGGVVTDLTEQNGALLPLSSGGSLEVPVDARGYAACRLLGVRVAG